MPAVKHPTVLITGANGFVGPHVADALRRLLGDRVSIVATSKIPGANASLGEIKSLDVTNAQAVADAVTAVSPSHVLHLAGIAAVHSANADPERAWAVHVFGALNVAEAILRCAPHCAMLFVGSGQAYGATARSGAPLDERAVLAPTNSYETTKAAADLALGAIAERGLRVVRLRPFNHTGRGQSEDFVVPSFATQIARIEAGRQPPVLRVGNLASERDFLDVRDVADAYALTIVKSAELTPGTILNIASGEARKISDLLSRLIALSGEKIEIEIDPAKLRPSDTPRYVGDASLARRLLSWLPVRSIDDALHEALQDSRRRVAELA